MKPADATTETLLLTLRACAREVLGRADNAALHPYLACVVERVETHLQLPPSRPNRRARRAKRQAAVS